MWFGRLTMYKNLSFFIYSCYICIISQQKKLQNFKKVVDKII